jgi:hypothetical protein
LRKLCERFVNHFVAAGTNPKPSLQLQQQRHCTHRHRPASVIGKAGELVEGFGSSCHMHVARGQQIAHALDGTRSPSSRLVVSVIENEVSKSNNSLLLEGSPV